jgi:hypothetical protein
MVGWSSERGNYVHAKVAAGCSEMAGKADKILDICRNKRYACK